MENRYDKYKDSGIAWIGEIPEHWEIKRLKNICSQTNIKENSKGNPLPYIGLENIESGSGKYIDTTSEVDGIANRFCKNNVLFGKLRPYLSKVYLAKSDGICSTEFIVYDTKENDCYFIHKLLLSQTFIDVVNSSTYGAKMPRANSEFINNIYTQIPPIQEQQHISTYLDQKCGEIDELITLQEEMITKLQSYKQSVITEAVTKGLDKNVPQKDSGIEWIGEIPEHWNLYRIKYHFSVISGSGFKNEIQGCTNGEIPVCKASDISNAGKELFESSNYLSKEIAIKEGFNIIPTGGILFPKIGEAMKKNNRSIAMIECCLDNNCQALIPTNINCIYSYYVFKIIDMSWYDNGGTIPSINNQKLINSFIPYPPLSEQQSIADYLDQKCSEIDELISIKQQKIEKLKDYKKSLIFECVTGKRKVS